MTSLRQIEANRRNARLSTGPVTEEGKRRSRQNAVRHGLTAETVIHADDYATFELAITSDFDAQSVVERELVLRLASLLWRLRRATAIETGLFEIQARQVLQFRRGRQVRQAREQAIETSCPNPIAPDDDAQLQERANDDAEGLTAASADTADDLTRSFIRLSNLPSYPLDRLSRYEATLWRQACQILFALQLLDRRKPWDRMRGGVR